MLKLTLPLPLEEEILKTPASLSQKESFWGGFLGEDNSIIDIIPLPFLYQDNIEDVLSEQESSFDVIIGHGGHSENLSFIKDFCEDCGLYFYHLKPFASAPKKDKPAKKSRVSKKKPPALDLEDKEIIVDTLPLEKEVLDSSKNQILEQEEESQTFKKLNTQKLREVFLNPEKNNLKKRSQQVQMIRLILDALENSAHLIIEASTGTGKSLAYLLPSILFAEQTNERVIIATHTKLLQTQLLEQDVPRALTLLDSELSVKVAKGKSNYLCLRRFWDYKDQITKRADDLFLSPKESEQMLETLDKFLTSSSNGDLDLFPFEFRLAKKHIAMQSELCNKKTCPFVAQCFYYKEWALLEKSSIIIVNHALLISQMDLYYKGVPYDLIPSASFLIVDEAHHFPNNALREFSYSSQTFYLEFFSISKESKGGCALLLREISKLNDYPSKGSLIQSLEDIASLREKSVEAFSVFFKYFPPLFNSSSSILRITEPQNPFLGLREYFESAKEHLLLLIQHLKETEEYLRGVPEEFQEQHEMLLAQFSLSLTVLENALEGFSVLFQEIPSSLALWVEPHNNHYTLHKVDTHNEVFLQSTLWEAYRSMIFTSATLSHKKNLSEIKSELHAPESKNLQKTILPPTFNYKEQARFFVPLDFPDPTKEEFVPQSLSFIAELIKASSSGVLVLCTSYKHMNEIVEKIASNIGNRPLLVQGQASMEKILEKAKECKNAVIVGVDSFWEGLDLPGKALELVIITKLPFPQPGDPIIETFCDTQKASGQNPFSKVLLMRAITKLQQGMGRLLRTAEDKGIIVCLDSRLTSKSYANLILDSLLIRPEKKKGDEILSLTKDFFKN